MLNLFMQHGNAKPFDDFRGSPPGNTAPTACVGSDDAVHAYDYVLLWFGLYPAEPVQNDRPDELARLSLTSAEDHDPLFDAEHDRSRWM